MEIVWSRAGWAVLEVEAEVAASLGTGKLSWTCLSTASSVAQTRARCCCSLQASSSVGELRAAQKYQPEAVVSHLKLGGRVAVVSCIACPDMAPLSLSAVPSQIKLVLRERAIAGVCLDLQSFAMHGSHVM